jgi:hypothetical protein
MSALIAEQHVAYVADGRFPEPIKFGEHPQVPRRVDWKDIEDSSDVSEEGREALIAS